MKVITITQPWATLVALGEKCIETRSWKTYHHGLLGIHAAKGFPNWARAMCFQHPFDTALARCGYETPDDLPTGALIATCSLVTCQLMTHRMIHDPNFSAWHFNGNFWELTEQERAFGHYETGRYAWLLRLVEPLDAPVEIGGKLGLWDYDGELIT
jgi:hypothetical protein